MTRIPEVLTRCLVPTMFSPSQLAMGERCLLRSVLGSNHDLPTLTGHPAAILGGVLHKLLEMAVRGVIQSLDAPSEAAEHTLDRLLDEADSQLAPTWPSGEPPRLREIFPPLVWRRKRRVVLDLAAKYISGGVPKVLERKRRGFLNAADLPVNGSWAEVQIEAPSLRLRGRADVIQRTDGNVVIRDLKTGRVVTSEGDIIPYIERQMQLYGSMAHVVWPSAQVTLVVDDGVERQVSFGYEDEADIRAWLQRVMHQLPPDTDVQSESLATPGEACNGCQSRHVCSAYRQQAPNFWHGEGSVRMPLDTWGEVLSVSRPQRGLVDATIRDAAGRTVKVFGLAAFRVADIRSGDTIWLFGLRTQEKCGGPGLWRAPHNFFEIADAEPSGRAWTLQSFVSD